MTYNTTPITSGSAKFSTLDPDADLFLEENNITVGANPENPATLYDYDTSTLNISHIVGNNGEVDLSNSDLIGVRRFVFQDYLGAIQTTSSNTVQKTIVLEDVNGGSYSSKKIRIPSNILSGSTMTVSAYIWIAGSGSRTFNIAKYDPDNNTYTTLDTVSASVDGYIDFNITVTGGDLIAFYAGSSSRILAESHDVSIKFDWQIVSGMVWDIVTP